MSKKAGTGVFLSASFYQKIIQTMKIQEIPRKSKVLEAPWIFLKFLESARFVGFSGKSLTVLAGLTQEYP